MIMGGSLGLDANCGVEGSCGCGLARAAGGKPRGGAYRQVRVTLYRMRATTIFRLETERRGDLLPTRHLSPRHSDESVRREGEALETSRRPIRCRAFVAAHMALTAAAKLREVKISSKTARRPEWIGVERMAHSGRWSDRKSTDDGH